MIGFGELIVRKAKNTLFITSAPAKLIILKLFILLCKDRHSAGAKKDNNENTFKSLTLLNTSP